MPGSYDLVVEEQAYHRRVEPARRARLPGPGACSGR
jgi:hypothetical protein